MTGEVQQNRSLLKRVALAVRSFLGFEGQAKAVTGTRVYTGPTAAERIAQAKGRKPGDNLKAASKAIRESMRDPSKQGYWEDYFIQGALMADNPSQFKTGMGLAKAFKPIDEMSPESQRKLADKAAEIDPIGSVGHHSMSDEEIAQAAARAKARRGR